MESGNSMISLGISKLYCILLEHDKIELVAERDEAAVVGRVQVTEP